MPVFIHTQKCSGGKFVDVVVVIIIPVWRQVTVAIRTYYIQQLQHTLNSAVAVQCWLAPCSLCAQQ